MKFIHQMIVATSLSLPTVSALAVENATDVNFGPIVGAGNASTPDTEVRSSSGFRLQVGERFAVGNGWNIGPLAEFTNNFVNTRQEIDNGVQVSNYDHRIFAGGLRVGKALGGDALSKEVFLQAVGGTAVSKLSVDSTAENRFQQTSMTGVNGRYAAAELGLRVPLQPNFSIQAGLQTALIRVDQSKAHGTMEAEEVGKGGKIRLQGSVEAENNQLETQVVQRLYTANLALNLAF